MDVVLRYDAKADILTMKLREGAVRDERLLDSDVVLVLAGRENWLPWRFGTPRSGGC